VSEVSPELEAEYLALLTAEDYARAEESLAHFTKCAFNVLEPGKVYVPNWHIDAICEHLEAVHLGQIRHLIINMPPRHMKTISVSVAFPCWTWLRRASTQFFTASYSDRLSTQINVDRRRLIESAWYQLAWGNRFQIEKDQNQKAMFENTVRGHMFSTSVGGSGTGEGGDILIIDDPVNPKMAASDTLRESANEWHDQTLTSRKNDPKTAAEIIVMQRLHEKDLTGHVLGKGDGKWTVLSLPTEAPTRHTVVFPVSGKKKIRQEGELLWPQRFGEKEIEEAKTDLGSAGFQGQHQQDPRPQAGGFFKREWWKYYDELPMNRIRRVMFIDCAEKPGVTNDFSVWATWDETPTGFYKVDNVADKVTFPQLEARTKTKFAELNPDAIVIEDKSAGTQLIQNLRANTTLPVIAYNPGRKDKVVRAAGAQPTVEAGNCYLPSHRPWVELFLSRHEKFPNDEHDDEVDTTSMMVDYFKTVKSQPRVRSL